MTAPTATAGSLGMGRAAALRGGSQAASAIVAELRGEEPMTRPANACRPAVRRRT